MVEQYRVEYKVVWKKNGREEFHNGYHSLEWARVKSQVPNDKYEIKILNIYLDDKVTLKPLRMRG